MRLLTIFAVLLTLVVHAATQATPDKAQAEIIKLEDRWLASEDDPAALESILADDFIHVLPMGITTKQQQIDFLRKHPSVRHEKRHFNNLRVRIYGDVGIANGAVIATNEKGAVRKTYFTDVFVRRNDRWQAVNAQENPEPNRADPKN